MKTAALSGWGQPHDALSILASDALAVDYARYRHAQGALLNIATLAGDAELIIGWSLGGQLAVRAVAGKLLKPRHLVLIATPFQFVATPEHALGMPEDLYDKFYASFADDPARTLSMAWESIIRGDTQQERVRAQLERHDKEAILKTDWLGWLDELKGFSCAGLDMAGVPPTLLIHGDRDAVVYAEQSQQFAKAIPNAKLLMLEGCGHAPHWHDTDAVAQAIREFAHA